MERTRRQRMGRRLVRWFHVEARDLPWRRTADPYAIWVSEIMLQQTRVETVKPYFERWMERFPTVEAMGRARIDTVLKMWEGLGYYSRARNLHAGAKSVAAEYGGRVPETVEELRRLPGIGRYTAGAVASIAFGLDEPVVDGNVKRVLCRVERIAEDPKRPAVERRLWELAREFIPKGRAGTFNQALMDLGATVCVPRRPLCGECPIREDCLAYAHGEQDALPVKAARKATPRYTIAAAVIRREGKVLIDKRPAEGLLGGLWEFPGGKKEKGETLREAAAREAMEEVGVEVRVDRRLMIVEHAYSHFRIRMHVYECTYMGGRARALACDQVRWVRPEELKKYAFPAANRKVIEKLLQR